MEPSITRAFKIAVAAVALTSCETKKTEEPPYRKVDNDHYVIKGEKFPFSPFRGMEFSSNLAKWRDEVSGNFTLVPVDSENPTVSGMAAYRTTTTSSDGKPNTINFSGGGSAESK